MVNEHGGHRRKRGLTQKTRDRFEKLTQLVKDNPDVPRVDLAQRVGWRWSTYCHVRKTIRREQKISKVDKNGNEVRDE